MPMSCAAFGCTARFKRNSDISFHKFPRDEDQRKKWVLAMRRDQWKPTASSKLCSRHFEAKCVRNLNGYRCLSEDAIPSIFSFPKHLQPKEAKPRERVKRNILPELDTEADDASPPPCKVARVPSASTSEALHDHNYFHGSPSKLIRKVKNLQQKVCKMKRKANVDKSKIWRRQRKISALEETKKKLCQRLSQSAGAMISGVFSDVFTRLIKKGNSEKQQGYSEDEKKFALTVQFHSSKAYNYLRKEGLPLPHPSTLRRWATRIDGTPGFTEEAFVKLKQEKSPLLCCLMFDEMAIKKQIDWNGKSSVGYCDLGFGDLQSDNVPLATQALVFLITAVNKTWKIPVGYCLIDGMTCAVKVNLIKQFLMKLHDNGIKCIALTCDGTATNLSCLKELGVKIEDGVVINSDFPHPKSQEAVNCFLDPAHMLKLVRNCFAEKGELELRTDDGRNLPVKWSHVQELHKLQETEGVHLANKLRRSHIEWQRQKMKVRLAAQTLSQSVADALKFLKQLEVNGFEDAEGTILFCEGINDIFDVLNSCHPMGKYAKAAINKKNKEITTERIEKGIRFLSSVFYNNIPVVSTQRKTAFLGLQMDLISLKNLASTLVWGEDPEMKFLLAQKFSQDHLELFFSTIRKRSGDNNNPTALEFCHAYRRTLVANIMPSSSSNCSINDTEMLLLEVGKTCPTQQPQALVTEEHNYVIPKYKPLSVLVDSVMEYVSGWILRALRKSIRCQECWEAIQASKAEDCLLVKIKDRGGLMKPPKDLTEICKMAEKVLRRKCSSGRKIGSEKSLLHQLCHETFQLVVDKGFYKTNDHLFESTENELLTSGPGATSHYAKVIKDILLAFFNLRLRHMARLESEDARGSSVRQKFTKLILFKGQ